MIDAPHTPSWQDNLRIGDIVLFQPAPTSLPGAAVPRPRRYLVFEIGTLEGTLSAVLYAASDEKPPEPLPRKDGTDGPDRYDRESLPRFFASDALCVALDHPGFVLDADTGAPTVGVLTGPALEKVLAIRHATKVCAQIRRDGVPGTWQLPFPDPHSERVGTLTITCLPASDTDLDTIH